MRIQVLTRANGFGLSKDIQVLKEALSEHEVTFTPYDKPLRNLKDRFHYNIHLELLNSAQFATGRVNVMVPNPEWFNPQWISSLRGVDMILAKTRDTERIFKNLHGKVEFIGWTSPQVSGTVDYTTPRVVHIAGESISKGTEQVIEAAKMLPDIPFTVVVKRKVDTPANVTIYTVADDQLVAQIRTAPIHCQPSTYEGFGHVINESRSMGAIVVTTAASPMDELVDASYALSAPACSTRPMRLASEQVVCADSLAECIQIAATACPKYGELWGNRAKEAYKTQRAEFTKRINELIQ
jgi:hypothetical protein